ncbi:MAG: hypothetical protein F6J97_21300 [Leptolyngbya sp. SIO4C1]|nr:hypothetical protein [Leptolyngbya sp. SIO4C1]
MSNLYKVNWENKRDPELLKEHNSPFENLIKMSTADPRIKKEIQNGLVTYQVNNGRFLAENQQKIPLYENVREKSLKNHPNISAFGSKGSEGTVKVILDKSSRTSLEGLSKQKKHTPEFNTMPTVDREKVQLKLSKKRNLSRDR